MYVMLNLKDQSLLQNVVNLLFSNGYTSLTIGESIEDLCPSCEKTSVSNTTTATSSTAADFLCSTPAKRGVKRPFPAASPLDKSADTTSTLQNVFLNMTDEAEETNCDQELLVEVKEEDNFLLNSAFQLFEQSKSNDGMTVSKWKRKIDEVGNEVFKCQLCQKSISRHGQYANLLNHLSRHAKLHASKKQYSCPLCLLSFTRKYLAANHIKETHNLENVEPKDFGSELKEEYQALLHVCFPGVMEKRASGPTRDDDDSAPSPQQTPPLDKSTEMKNDTKEGSWESLTESHPETVVVSAS